MTPMEESEQACPCKEAILDASCVLPALQLAHCSTSLCGCWSTFARNVEHVETGPIEDGLIQAARSP
jgi:hypothetical protein